MPNPFFSILSKVKSFFSKPGGAAAGGAAAGFTLGAAAAAGVTHAITRRVVTTQMQSIASNADFRQLQDDFVAALRHVTRTEKRAQAICERALKDSPLFREAGKVRGDEARFNNATTDAEFLTVYNRILSSVDGRADRLVLLAISQFKNDILEGVVGYFVTKQFLIEDERYTWRDFSRRLTRNPDCQMDRGIATMIVFSNIFLALYEHFFETISNAAHMYQVNHGGGGGAAGEEMPEEEIAELFMEMLIGFIISIRPAMELGDSSVLNFLRATFNIPSERSKVLADLKARVEKNRGLITTLMGEHAEREKVFSLPEGLVWFGEVASGYTLRFACTLMQKRCSMLREQDVWDVTTRDCNTPLIEVLQNSGRGLYQDSLRLPPKIKLVTMGRLKKAGVSKVVLHRAVNQLHILVLWQSLSNHLSGAIQALASNKGRDSLGSTMMSAFVALLDCCHQGMKRTLQELLHGRGSYYDLWSKRHCRVYKKIHDGTMRRRPSEETVFLRGKDGRGSLLFVRDLELLKLWRKAHQLPVSYAQRRIRTMIGSLQYQQDLLAELKNLRLQYLKGLSGRPIAPLYCEHLDVPVRDAFEFCAYLWANKARHPFSTAFQQHWKRYQTRPGVVIEDGPDGVSQVQLLTASIAYRDRAIEALGSLIRKTRKIMCIRGLSLRVLNKLIKAVRARELRFTVLTIEKKAFSYLHVEVEADLLRGRSSYEAIRGELLDLLNWLAKYEIAGAAPFQQLATLATEYHFVEVESPTDAVTKRTLTRHNSLASLGGLSHSTRMTDPMASVDSDDSESELSEDDEVVFDESPTRQSFMSAAAAAGYYDRDDLASGGGGQKARSPHQSFSGSLSDDGLGVEDAFSGGGGGAAGDAAAGNPFGLSDTSSEEGDPSNPFADETAEGDVEFEEDAARLSPRAVRRARPRGRQALTPHEPLPELNTQLPIVRTEAAYWWAIGWFGAGKRDKRDDVFYALYQVRAMVQRLHGNSQAALADGTLVSDRLTTVLLETLDRAGSHRVSQRETPAEADVMHVAKSGRSFVKRLLREENRYYLEALLIAAVRLNQEIGGEAQRRDELPSRLSVLRPFRDGRGFTDHLGQLRADFDGQGNRTLRQRIDTASRALFTFRVLHYLSERIKKGAQTYTADEVLETGQRFFASHRVARHVLEHLPEADALSAEGRAAARGEAVVSLE